MPKSNQTELTLLKIRERQLFSEASNPSKIEWKDIPEKACGQHLLKNMGVASALVLCAATLRAGAIPPLSEAADVVLTAATDHSLLENPLGKLSFVSAIFPETVLVFGKQDKYLPLTEGEIVHVWSETEPYMMLHSNTVDVFSVANGEVLGIYHGNDDEHLVQVSQGNKVTYMYGNLETVAVSTGDFISAGTLLGKLLPGKELVFEMRKNGISVDPTIYLFR